MDLYDAIKFCPLFMVLAFATGCAQRTDYVFVMPPETSTRDVQAATVAAAEWQACGIVNATVRVGQPEGEDITLRRVDVVADLPSSTGEASKNGPITYVDYDGTEPTIAHEMGHVFGLPHVATGLMRATNTTDAAQMHVTPVECAALSGRD